MAGLNAQTLAQFMILVGPDDWSREKGLRDLLLEHCRVKHSMKGKWLLFQSQITQSQPESLTLAPPGAIGLDWAQPDICSVGASSAEQSHPV